MNPPMPPGHVPDGMGFPFSPSIMSAAKIPSLVDFLNASPTQYHSTDAIRNTLLDNGFTWLDEREEWRLVPGGKYFVMRNDSSLLALRLAENAPLSGARMAVSHTDSPAFKLRFKDAEVQNGMLRIPVEIYGGASNPTWLDRPLKVAGRICLRDDMGNLQIRKICGNAPQAVIPNPPIHFVDLNGGHRFNQQTQLAACLPYPTLQEFVDTLVPEGFPQQKAEELQAELFLADSEGAVIIGDKTPFIQSTHLDNLTSCYGILKALCAPQKPLRTVVGGFFDLEEVGLNFQSAGSNFLWSTLSRVAVALGETSPQALPRMLADSLCLSIDVAHAFHPNFPELFDKPMAATVGHGPALKFHANQAYATTFTGAALLREIARDAEIPLQDFLPRSDGHCGSTIGRIVAGALGIQTVDIGVAIWAMHSIRETCAVADVDYLSALVEKYYLQGVTESF